MINEVSPTDPQLQQQETTADVRAWLQVLVRRRWYATGAFFIVLVVGVLVTIRTPRIYRATNTVMIERETPRVLGDVREVYDLGTGGYWNAQEYFQTQYEVIHSRPVAERAAVELGIQAKVLAEALRATGPEPAEAALAQDPMAGLSRELRNKLEFVGMTHFRTRADILRALDEFDAAAFITSRVVVTPVKDSRLVQISVEHGSPEAAALIANAVAKAYEEANLDQKVDFTRSAVDWLSDQTRELKTRLKRSELALYEFKKANNVVSMSMEDRQSIISQTLTLLNASLSEMQARRYTTESQRSRLRRARTEGADATVDAVIQNDLVQKLKLARSTLEQEESDLAIRYTPDHPRLLAVRRKRDLVERDLSAEIARILSTLDARYTEALDAERRLRNAIEKVKAEALDLNKKEIEYSRLQRERDNNQALYEMVLKRQKEADLTEMLKVNNVRVHEVARRPKVPIKPRLLMNFLATLVLGFLVGIGTAFLVDFLDNTIKGQEQVQQILKLPLLGILPAIKPEKGSKLTTAPQRDRYIVAHPRSSVAECARTVRTNLLFMSPDEPAKLLVVTSSGPREGKSTTVVNLAVTMAQSGARTVVIDTDMRRPRLHKSFGLDNQLGVTNVILGNASLSEVVQPTGVDSLDAISSGPIPPNPAELLHADAFKRLIEELAGRYDRVLFDSPPVAAVSDPLVLSSMVDGVVLVVQAGKTSWQAALQAKRRLQDIGARLFGVVLNDVDLESKNFGGYYHYYDYYDSSHGDDDDNESTRAAS